MTRWQCLSILWHRILHMSSGCELKKMIKELVYTCVSIARFWSALKYKGLSPRLGLTFVLAHELASLQASYILCWVLSPQPLMFWSVLHASPNSFHCASLHRVPAPPQFIPCQGQRLPAFTAIVVKIWLINVLCVQDITSLDIHRVRLMVLKVLLFT